MAVDVAKTATFYRRALGLVARSESPCLHDGGAKAATETHPDGNRFWLAQVSS